MPPLSIISAPDSARILFPARSGSGGPGRKMTMLWAAVEPRRLPGFSTAACARGDVADPRTVIPPAMAAAVLRVTPISGQPLDAVLLAPAPGAPTRDVRHVIRASAKLTDRVHSRTVSRVRPCGMKFSYCTADAPAANFQCVAPTRGTPGAAVARTAVPVLTQGDWGTAALAAEPTAAVLSTARCRSASRRHTFPKARRMAAALLDCLRSSLFRSRSVPARRRVCM